MRTGNEDEDDDDDEFDEMAPHQQQQPESPGARDVGYSSRHILELRLMHHYSNAAVDAFVVGLEWEPSFVRIMKNDVPLLALNHLFLMDTLLSVSMLHLASTEPQMRDVLPIVPYREQAHRSFRKELVNMTAETLRQVTMASLLLVSTSFVVDRLSDHSGIWLIDWMALPTGPRLFINPRSASADATPVYETPPLFDSGGFSPVDPVSPLLVPLHLQAVLPVSEEDVDWPHRTDLVQAVTGVGKLFGALASPSLQLLIPSKVRSWPAQFVTTNFVHLAKQHHPKALVVVAYVLAFFNFLPRVWIFEGVARGDMARLERLIEPGWELYLAVPKRAVLIDNPMVLKDFLLSQLPSMSYGDPAAFAFGT